MPDAKGLRAFLRCLSGFESEAEVGSVLNVIKGIENVNLDYDHACLDIERVSELDLNLNHSSLFNQIAVKDPCIGQDEKFFLGLRLGVLLRYVLFGDHFPRASGERESENGTKSDQAPLPAIPRQIDAFFLGLLLGRFVDESWTV